MRRLQNGDSLEDKSRCPDYSPTKVCKEIEKKVIELRKKTRYGPHRLSDWLLRTEGIEISPWTIRNILNRNNLVKKTKRRSTCYPAHWAWEEENPFSLMQADVKDVYDKDTLGTERTTHLSRIGLPRYQWTVLEGQSRLRLMAYSYQLTITCGIAFLVICLEWLRSWGIDCKIQIQTDWGQEFGGDNPHKIQELNEKYFLPRGAELCRLSKRA
jgi:hypothetical protein